jgi:hypothetical protein
VMSGGSYYSHNDLRLHFGLGTATKVDTITVNWPSAMMDRLEGIRANQILTIKEGSAPIPIGPGSGHER